jgi:hypothetical protein
MEQFCKYVFAVCGGVLGWLWSEFEPVFPLIIVVVLCILYDAWTAFQLDKRVKAKYPDKMKRREAKFTSFAFGKVVTSTMPKRFVLILLAFLIEKYVCVHWDLHLEYIVTGIICFEQAWSILENESSCREDEDSRIYRMLQRIMVDKSERHFDVELDEELKKERRRVRRGRGDNREIIGR